MSTWFTDRRQEFIAATLRHFGQIRRADLVRQFDISTPQASADIAAFLASDPPHVTYDVSAKAYVFDNDSPDIERGPIMARLLNEATIKIENDRTLWTEEWQRWLADVRAILQENPNDR